MAYKKINKITNVLASSQVDTNTFLKTFLHISIISKLIHIWKKKTLSPQTLITVCHPSPHICDVLYPACAFLALHVHQHVFTLN